MMMLASPRAGSPDRPRLRLPAEVRVQQILDGALAVFTLKGYAAARMDDIAAGCGLSKGGLYAHFDSKEQVFEALLASALQPVQPAPPPAGAGNEEALADWLLDGLHGCMEDPRRRDVFKLLVAEADRVPTMVMRWRQEVVQPYLDALQEVMRHRLASGTGQADPAGVQAGIALLGQEPWLALSPAIHGLLMHSILPVQARQPASRIRAAHRALLLLLLRGAP